MPLHGPGMAKGRALARAHGRPRTDLGPPQAPKFSAALRRSLASVQPVRLPREETATVAGRSSCGRTHMGRGQVSGRGTLRVVDEGRRPAEKWPAGVTDGSCGITKMYLTMAEPTSVAGRRPRLRWAEKGSCA